MQVGLQLQPIFSFCSFFNTRDVFVHLPPGSSHTPSSIHDASDGSQSLLTPPQSVLPAQVSGYGRADHIRRATNEEASGGQQRGIDHLVVR